MAEKIKTEEVIAVTKDGMKSDTEKVTTIEQPVETNTKSSGKKIESLEVALRRFKKQSSGIISEVRKREAYDKPSVKRKKKSKEARKHKKTGRFGSAKW